MSYIEPNSLVKIYTTDESGAPVPFDPNMENTVLFVNAEQQYDYLEAFRPVTLTKNSYTRANRGVIKVGFESDITSEVYKDKIIAAVYNANYLAFKNTSFENKWFYAFIDSTEYLNNNTVTISYHIDVIQTYMFDWKFNQCLIEREHTVSDKYGEHTLPEGLETGPYRSIPASVYLQDPLSPTGESFMYNRFEYKRCVVVATSFDIDDILSASGDVISRKPRYAYGVIIPGAAGYGGGGEYYSGVRYNVFRIESEPEQGVYEVMFSDNFAEGDTIYFGDVTLTLSASQAVDDYSVARAVADKVYSESAQYSAVLDQSDLRVIVVTERSGSYGVGVPYFSTDSEKGYAAIKTLVPGTDGSLSEINKLNKFFKTVASSNLEAGVLCAFMMPYEFFPKGDQLVDGVSPLSMRVPFPTMLGSPLVDDGYIPRNKKLFCSPYNELYVTNNSGNEAQYKFEEFSNPDARESCMFSIWGNLSTNPGMYCAPLFYNGNGYMSGAVDDELVLSGFPMCSFTTDSFRAWLSQNAGVIGATAGSLIAGWTSTVSKAYSTSATGLINAGIMSADPGPNVAGVNPAGYIGKHAMYTPKENANLRSYMSGQNQSFTGLIGATLGALGTLYDHSRRPPQSHGAMNGNLTYQAAQLTFSWYYKQIKQEYAEIIDKFFDMYGYKTNRVGTPVLNARPKYSYVKTIGCSIDGLIPGDMKAAIESIFDKGIRFWEPSAVFGNYDPEVNPNSPAEVGETNG